mgnify:CR=1 FL=1
MMRKSHDELELSLILIHEQALPGDKRSEVSGPGTSAIYRVQARRQLRSL